VPQVVKFKEILDGFEFGAGLRLFGEVGAVGAGCLDRVADELLGRISSDWICCGAMICSWRSVCR
jgi:hypothetical protein